MSAGAAFAYSTNTSKYRSSVEYAGVEQFVFGIQAAATSVGIDEIDVGECILRIFIEIFHVGVRRRAVEVEIVLLAVFAVIALAVGQAE